MYIATLMNSTVMDTVIEFKKFLNDCLEEDTVYYSSDTMQNNVLIKIVTPWLRRYDYDGNLANHIYIAWFAMREMLQTIPLRNIGWPETTGTFATAVKYFDEFKKAERYNQDVTMKECIHKYSRGHYQYIITAFKITSVAGVFYDLYTQQDERIDINLPEGKEFNGILNSPDLIVDINVHQKSTYEMMRDLKKYLKECMKKNEIIEYEGSNYVDLIDIAIAMMNGAYVQTYSCKEVPIKDLVYLVWLAFVVYMNKEYDDGSLDAAEEIYKTLNLDAVADKLDNIITHDNIYYQRYKQYTCCDNAENNMHWHRVCMIHYFIVKKLIKYMNYYNDYIKRVEFNDWKLEDEEPFVEVVPATEITVKIADEMTNDCNKLTTYKDTICEIIVNNAMRLFIDKCANPMPEEERAPSVYTKPAVDEVTVHNIGKLFEYKDKLSDIINDIVRIIEQKENM